jgi:hypothetical protein
MLALVAVDHGLDVLDQLALGLGPAAHRLGPGRQGLAPEQGMPADRLLVGAREADQLIGPRKVELAALVPDRLPFEVVHRHDHIAIALQRLAIAAIPTKGLDLGGRSQRNRRWLAAAGSLRQRRRHEPGSPGATQRAA